MSYGVKYRIGHYGGQTRWQVDILAPDFVGDVTVLKGSGDPVQVTWENNSDDIFDPIRASKALVRVVTTVNFQLEDMYSYDDQYYKMKVYCNSTLFWQGWVSMKNYQEPYKPANNIVSISAVCGLELLKEILYEDTSGFYTGRRLESQIILDLLGKIGYTEFKEFVNIYDTAMASAVGDSPSDQLKLEADNFEDKYCYEVLEHILFKFNARITQKQGIFQITRAKELIGATVYGRYFTGATTKTAVSYTPLQYIDRSGHASNLKEVTGGVIMRYPPAKKVTAVQDYGNRESWLRNFKFSADTYDGNDFEFWERTDGLTVEPIGNYLPGEKDGVAIGRDTTLNTLKYISQTIGTYAITTTDIFGIEFDYLIYNYSGATITNCALYIMIKKDGANYWLRGSFSEFLTWDTSPYYVGTGTISVEDGSTGWVSLRKKVIGIPATGTYTVYFVRLYSPTEPDVVGAIKNVRFYTTSSEIRSKKVRKSFRERIKDKDPSKFIFGGWGSKYKTVTYKEPTDFNVESSYVKDNEIKGKELEYEYILSDVIKTSTPASTSDVNIDNIIEQFMGSLAYFVSGVIGLTTSWATRGYSEDRMLKEIICDEIAHQYKTPKRLIQMPIQEIGTGIPNLNILGSFQDDVYQVSGVNRNFVFSRGSYNTKRRRWDVDLMEIATGQPPEPVTPDAPDAPVATDATLIDTTIFTANWEASTGANRYYLDVSESNVFASFVTGFENLNVGNNLLYNVTGLDVSTTYYYRVRAHDIFGQDSSNSNSITVATLASATYQLYTDSKFFFIVENGTDNWTVSVTNLSGSVGYNNNFRLKLVGQLTEGGDPASYTAITADVSIAAGATEDVYGEWNEGEIIGFDFDAEYTLSIEYDQGSADFVMLASKTYN